MDGSEILPTGEEEEEERRGECQLGELLSCLCPFRGRVTRNVLFWPTVGPILSAGIPGVGLYSVLIFSSIV